MFQEWIDWYTMSRSSVATKFNVEDFHFRLVKRGAVAECVKVLLVRENIQKPKSFRDM